MNANLESTLSRSGLTEEQFLAGIPAMFKLYPQNKSELRLNIICLYRDNKILIESSTYRSLQHYRKVLNREYSDHKELSEIIVVDDFTKLDETLKYVADNLITTIPAISLIDDKNLQIVIAIIMSKGYPMPNLEGRDLSIEDIQREGFINRLKRCPVIDDWWKEEHLKDL